MFLAVGFVVGCKLGMVADGEMGNEMFLELFFVDECEGVGEGVQAVDAAFLSRTKPTSESTIKWAVHISIRYPGELIHFLTFSSN